MPTWWACSSSICGFTTRRGANGEPCAVAAPRGERRGECIGGTAAGRDRAAVLRGASRWGDRGGAGGGGAARSAHSGGGAVSSDTWAGAGRSAGGAAAVIAMDG